MLIEHAGFEQLRRAAARPEDPDGRTPIRSGFRTACRFNHLHPAVRQPEDRAGRDAAINQEALSCARRSVFQRAVSAPAPRSTPAARRMASAKRATDIRSSRNVRGGAEAAQGGRATTARRWCMMKPTDLAAIQQAARRRRATAAPGRLQGGHAGDGLADPGRRAAPRRTRSARAAGTSSSPPGWRPTSGTRSPTRRSARSARKRGSAGPRDAEAGEAARPVRARDRRGEEEGAGREASRRAPSRSARTRRSANTSSRSPRDAISPASSSGRAISTGTLRRTDRLPRPAARRHRTGAAGGGRAGVSLLRLAPGDPAAIMAGDAATAEQIERIRAGLGLDKPIVVQFGIWLGKVLSRRPRRVVLLPIKVDDADRPAPRADFRARAR